MQNNSSLSDLIPARLEEETRIIGQINPDSGG